MVLCLISPVVYVSPTEDTIEHIKVHNEVITHTDRFTHNSENNIYTNLVDEHVGIMKVRICFICIYLPSSAGDRSTYFQLPFSNSMSCTVFVTVFN